jgi:hypothetical protein
MRSFFRACRNYAYGGRTPISRRLTNAAIDRRSENCAERRPSILLTRSQLSPDVRCHLAPMHD